MQGTNLSVSLLSQVRRAVGLHITKCGNSSVGRARPCQGRGREFKSRFPLFNQTVVRLSDFVYRLEFATLSPVGKRPKEMLCHFEGATATEKSAQTTAAAHVSCRGRKAVGICPNECHSAMYRPWITTETRVLKKGRPIIGRPSVIKESYWFFLGTRMPSGHTAGLWATASLPLPVQSLTTSPEPSLNFQ